MKFSVLMSVYAKEKTSYLEECINSILNQTVMPDEIVIMEDGELTSDLHDILKKYKNKYANLFKLYPNSANRGLGATLRDGVNNCKNEIIARMDTDDICIPDRFEKQIKFLVNNPEIDIVGGYITEFDSDSYKILSIREVPLSNELIKRRLKYRNPLNHVSVMFKKSKVLIAGNYIPFYFKEDYYLWARMAKYNLKMANIKDILVMVRVDNNMYKRRGGLKYIKYDYILQKEFLKLKIVNIWEFGINCLIRTIAGIIPNILRKYFYLFFLRKNTTDKVYKRY